MKDHEFLMNYTDVCFRFGKWHIFDFLFVVLTDLLYMAHILNDVSATSWTRWRQTHPYFSSSAPRRPTAEVEVAERVPVYSPLRSDEIRRGRCLQDGQTTKRLNVWLQIRGLCEREWDQAKKTASAIPSTEKKISWSLSQSFVYIFPILVQLRL